MDNILVKELEIFATAYGQEEEIRILNRKTRVKLI